MAITVLVSTTCVVLSAVSPQNPPSDARKVLRNPSVTLASALRDTDRALVVESARAAPLRVSSPDDRSEIAYAVVPWERPYVSGERYLLFGSPGEGSKELEVGVAYQIVQGNRLKSLDPRAGKLYQDEVERMTLEAALAEVRAAAKRE